MSCFVRLVEAERAPREHGVASITKNFGPGLFRNFEQSAGAFDAFGIFSSHEPGKRECAMGHGHAVAVVRCNSAFERLVHVGQPVGRPAEAGQGATAIAVSEKDSVM